MLRTVFNIGMIAIASPAWSGVEQCLEYGDNRSVAQCVERHGGGPVPTARKALLTTRKVETGAQLIVPEPEMRSVKVTLLRNEDNTVVGVAMSTVETTVRSMNPWYFILPGLALLVILFQLAGRAMFGNRAYAPAAGRSGAGSGLMGRIAARYRRCPYCGAGASRGSSVCKKCLRALPA